MPGAVAGAATGARSGLAQYYVNPLSKAKVRAERIDQGVDYAGTGSIAALGDGVVTNVSGSGSGWPGNFISYQLTSGPLEGLEVFNAEGVTPLVKVGQKVKAGDVIANLIPGWATGIETGFGSGQGTSTYAAAHGGYSEGQLTESGVQFSQVLQELGAPAGLAQGRTPIGSGPLDASGLSKVAGAVAAPAVAAGTAVSDAANAARAFAGFLSDPVPVLLTVGVVLLGALMIFSGTGKLLGFDTPLRSAASRVKSAAKVGAAAA